MGPGHKQKVSNEMTTTSKTRQQPRGLRDVPYESGAVHFSLKATQGLPVRVIGEEGKVNRFIGGGGRVVTDLDADGYTEWVLANALIQLADGTLMHGLVELCATDSGEHYGSYVFIREDLADEGYALPHLISLDSDSLNGDDAKRLGLTRERVYGERQGAGAAGYKYNYGTQVGLRWRDHHVDDETGWSL